MVLDEAPIIWLQLVKQNGWEKDSEVDLILTYANAP